jgi:hypothetical protein
MLTRGDIDVRAHAGRWIARVVGAGIKIVAVLGSEHTYVAETAHAASCGKAGVGVFRDALGIPASLALDAFRRAILIEIVSARTGVEIAGIQGADICIVTVLRDLFASAGVQIAPAGSAQRLVLAIAVLLATNPALGDVDVPTADTGCAVVQCTWVRIVTKFPDVATPSNRAGVRRTNIAVIAVTVCNAFLAAIWDSRVHATILGRTAIAGTWVAVIA